MTNYTDQLVWVPKGESIIPNDKYSFIIEKGIKAFIRECCYTSVYVNPADNLESFTERCIEWAHIPDDWSKEQWIRACAPLIPEVWEEELETRRKVDEFREEWEEKQKEADDDE